MPEDILLNALFQIDEGFDELSSLSSSIKKNKRETLEILSKLNDKRFIEMEKEGMDVFDILLTESGEEFLKKSQNKVDSFINKKSDKKRETSLVAVKREIMIVK